MNFLKIPYMQEFQSFSIKINLCFNSIFLNVFFFFFEAEVMREGSEPTLASYWNPKLLYGAGARCQEPSSLPEPQWQEAGFRRTSLETNLDTGTQDLGLSHGANAQPLHGPAAAPCRAHTQKEGTTGPNAHPSMDGPAAAPCRAHTQREGTTARHSTHSREEPSSPEPAQLQQQALHTSAHCEQP